MPKQKEIERPNPQREDSSLEEGHEAHPTAEEDEEEGEEEHHPSEEDLLEEEEEEDEEGDSLITLKETTMSPTHPAPKKM